MCSFCVSACCHLSDCLSALLRQPRWSHLLCVIRCLYLVRVCCACCQIVVCSCQFVLSSSLSPVCFLPRTPAVLDRVSASQSPCLGDLLVCLRPSSYSPCFIFHCLSNKLHSTCNWILSSHSLTVLGPNSWTLKM